MKKLILITAIFATLNSQAFAKTEGNYFGIDVVRNSIDVETNSNSPHQDDIKYYNHKKSDDSFGIGVNYKYAYNFNNFFLAPAISYNFINSEIKTGYYETIIPYSQKTKINSQLNAQVNLGYDITDKFAFYIPVGVSMVSYQVDTDDRALGGGYSITKKTGRETAGFIGFGLSYQIAKNWLVNLEYNKFQEIEVKSNQATVGNYDINTKINMDSVKLGLAYNF